MIVNDHIAVAGAVGPMSLEDTLYQARKTGRIAALQVLRADRVVGVDHLTSAAMHAQRAFDEGRNHADDLAVEFTRYVAGERQIRKALDKVGILDGSPAAAVVGLGEKAEDAVAHFLHALGLESDDSVLDATPEKLRGFGITDAQIEATAPERVTDLVLERVAAVDLMRK